MSISPDQTAAALRIATSDIDSGPGDSGGPLYVTDGDTGSNEIVGVISQGTDLLGIACSLNAHESWLTTEIESTNYYYNQNLSHLFL